ncbi:hypothetical protein SK128_024270, partial [Halocaridina rubra]
TEFIENIDWEYFERGPLKLLNTPISAGHSPTQVLYGCPLYSCVPTQPESISKEWQAQTEDCDCRAVAHTEQVKRQYNSHTRPLAWLTAGQHVQIQDPISRHFIGLSSYGLLQVQDVRGTSSQRTSLVVESSTSPSSALS